MTAPRENHPDEQDPRAGFSLLEVVVSMVIMAYGVLGLAGATMYTVREVSVSELNSKRAGAVQFAVETIRSQPFDLIATGSDTLGVFVVEWAATTVGNSKLLEVVSTGPGVVVTAQGPIISPTATDTLEFRVVKP